MTNTENVSKAAQKNAQPQREIAGSFHESIYPPESLKLLLKRLWNRKKDEGTNGREKSLGRLNSQMKLLNDTMLKMRSLSALL